MSDKSDEILEKQKQILEELKNISPLITTVSELKINTANLAEWAKSYREVQVPKCDDKFEKIDGKITSKVGGVYNKLWWLVGIFLIAVIGLLFKMFVENGKP